MCLPTCGTMLQHSYRFTCHLVWHCRPVNQTSEYLSEVEITLQPHPMLDQAEATTDIHTIIYVAHGFVRKLESVYKLCICPSRQLHCQLHNLLTSAPPITVKLIWTFYEGIRFFNGKQQSYFQAIFNKVSGSSAVKTVDFFFEVI